jgi:peptidoglycan/xylan/chitin deacetylase (PgdA/CDA1 family)
LRESFVAGPLLTCVAYHHFEAEPSDATRHLGISTPPDIFRGHLDYYQLHFNVVGLDAVLAGDLPERALLITLDDAYRSIAEVAAPLLKERDLPAVLFTNPRVITGPCVPLDNLLSIALAALAFLLGQSGPATFGDLITGPVSRMSAMQRERLRTDLLARLSTPEAQLYRVLDLFLTPGQLMELPGAGIEVANHTRSHVHCGALTPDEIKSEIIDAKAEIEDLTGQPVRAFSFPYGNERDATPAVLSALRKSGHEASFLVHARANRQRPAADLWYRTSLTDDPTYKLGLKLGMLPALRSLKLASRSLISGA